MNFKKYPFEGNNEKEVFDSLKKILKEELILMINYLIYGSRIIAMIILFFQSLKKKKNFALTLIE